MEDKKKIRISLSTFLLILALIVIICMGYLVVKLYNDKNNETNKVSELNTKINDLEKSINTLSNNMNNTSNELSSNVQTNTTTNTSKNTTASKEIINLDSTYGKAISDYIESIWVGPEAYTDCIAEFSNIKSAPKDYLAVCASFKLMRKVGENIYTEKSKFSEFNNSLIELFGNDADGLITTSNIEKVFFVEKNSDGTYHFSGFDGSETSGTDYIINKIEKQDNIFYVTQYEYKYTLDEMVIDLENGESTHRHIYDRNDRLILNTTITAVQDGNTTSYKEYDENGTEVDSIQNLLLSNYLNKLSVRNIKLEYNSNNLFNMVSNELK